MVFDEDLGRSSNSPPCRTDYLTISEPVMPVSDLCGLNAALGTDCRGDGSTYAQSPSPRGLESQSWGTCLPREVGPRDGMLTRWPSEVNPDLTPADLYPMFAVGCDDVPLLSVSQACQVPEIVE